MASASFRSIPEIFLHRVTSTPDSDAFTSPKNGGWETISWADVGNRVRAISAGLLHHGLEAEQRCSILCGTRVEWILADLGILCGGGATTTIYPSNTAEECAYIIDDSNSAFVFAEDEEQVDKLLSVRDQMSTLKRVIVIDGESGHDGWVISLEQLEQEGSTRLAEHPSEFEEVARSVGPDQLATLIYTSGTTGRPKGVELTHQCWVFEGEAMDKIGIMSAADRQYLFLPLAHSFAKVLEVAILRIGIPTVIDGRIDTLVDNLGVVQPTFMGAVPRIFEKVYNKVVSGAHEAGGLKLRIFNWSIGVGARVSAIRQQGGEPSGLLAVKNAVADRLVFSKLRARFGGKIRFFISGGAPLSREIAEFFHACGILILEGYGLTESSAASFVNTPDAYKFGTVGQALPGVELKIAEADGEILIKSPGVMRGYANLPEASAEVLSDGWLHTGDIGELDAKGFLKITDRKKDLIKTSGGKYVAPQKLEGKLKTLSPYISQVLVHGNLRNFCSALITVNEDEIRRWAADNGMGSSSYAQITSDDRTKSMISQFVSELNRGLASYETIKMFALLPADFAQETGELTPTLKVKRKVVESKYKTVLDGFYAGAVQSI
jgi:long-chain acyl-CoA synthetase